MEYCAAERKELLPLILPPLALSMCPLYMFLEDPLKSNRLSHNEGNKYLINGTVRLHCVNGSAWLDINSPLVVSDLNIIVCYMAKHISSGKRR